MARKQLWKPKAEELVAPLALVFAFVLAAQWSWRKWPDAFIDSGYEPYISWQITLGKVLYRDIAFRSGPIYVYLNSLFFLLFGTSFRTLIFCNLAIFAGLIALIHSIFSDAFDRATAFLCCLVLIGVFGFSQYVGIGNYNFVWPYSYSQTHGLFFSVSMIFFLLRFIQTRNLRWCLAAGLCFGAVALTKVEITMAAAFAALAGLGLAAVQEANRKRAARSILLAFGAGTIIPILAFIVFLSAQMPLAAALKGMLGNYRAMFAGYGGNQFFKKSMGTDHPFQNLIRMGPMTGGIFLFVGTMAAIDRATAGSRRRLWIKVGLSLGTVIVLAGVRWQNIGRPLPLISLSALAGSLAVIGKCWNDEPLIRKAALVLMWSAFSFALLTKIMLNSRLYHYGFALAMPAALLFVAAAVYLLPEFLRRKCGGGDVVRWAMIAAVLSGGWFYLRWSNRFYSMKTFELGTGKDSVITYAPEIDRTGFGIAETIREIESVTPSTSTLMVLPEGAIINFLTRRSNPTPYTVFIPLEEDFYGGEEAALQSMRANPPDSIVLIDRDTREFGYEYFGSTPRNGKKIMDWVRAHYKQVFLFDHQPLTDGQFGIALLKKTS